MLHLSHQDVDRIQKLLALLHSPLDAADIEEWRADVNRRLQALLGADTVNFTVPFRWMPPSGLLGVDPKAAEEYFGYFAERDPGPAARRALGLAICAQRSIYSSELPKTELYNEFFVPHALVGGVAMNADLPDGTFAFIGASRKKMDPARERRWMNLMGLILPAFEAGIRSLWRLGEQRTDLLGLVDRLPVGVGIYSSESLAPLHMNRVVTEILDANADSGRIREAMVAAAGSAAAISVGRTPLGPTNWKPCVRTIATSAGSYTIHGTCMGLEGARRERLVMVVVERSGSALPPAEIVGKRFGLTPRESEVALLLAQGLTDRQIAERLTVSWHTARSHSERVLRKLGASTRAEVATRILDAA